MTKQRSVNEQAAWEANRIATGAFSTYVGILRDRFLRPLRILIEEHYEQPNPPEIDWHELSEAVFEQDVDKIAELLPGYEPLS